MEEPVHIFHYLKIIHDDVEKRTNALLKEHDLTLMQGQVLGYLMHCESHTASLKEIEKYLNTAQSTVAGIVLRLEKKNFIETVTNENDKRVKMIRLTELSIENIGYVRKSVKQVEIDLLSGLTDIEKTLFTDLLKRVATQNDI